MIYPQCLERRKLIDTLQLLVSDVVEILLQLHFTIILSSFVLDGANIGFYMRKYADGKFGYRQIQAVVS